MIALLATVLLATSSDPALLAPGPEELNASFERTEFLLARSSAIERALARLHNRWAELAVSGAIKNVCDDMEARSLAARTRALGAGLRDAVQSARAQQHRLDHVYAAPTVSAVIDPKAKRRYERTKAGVAAAIARWSELRAWQHAEIERAIKRCKAPIELSPAPGLGSSVPCAGEECVQPVAIIGIGLGRICPINQLADGTAVVVPDGQACYGDARCRCVPTPVLPGAVLGP